MWGSLLFLVFLVSTFLTSSPQVWTGYSIDSSTSFAIDTTIFTTTILSLSVPVYGAGDAVFLVVNLNVVATANNQDLQLCIFRAGTNVAPGGNILVEISPKFGGESQSTTFSYLDTPGSAGTYLYEVRPKYQGTVSSDSQVRQLAAIVIPAAMPATSGVTYTTTSSFADNQYAVTGAAASFTTTSTFNKVLIAASMSVSPTSGSSTMKGVVYKGGTAIVAKAFQHLRFSGAGDSRMFSMFYLDSPSTVGSLSYQLRAGRIDNADDGFTVCAGSYNVAQMSLLAVSGTMSNSLTASDALVLSLQSWQPMGLITNITTISATNKVLVTVTFNYKPNQSSNRAAFTIYRGDSTNLGNSDSGLQILSTSSNGESASGTMTYLDSPNAIGLQTYKAMAKTFDGDAFTVSSLNQIRQIAVFLTSDPITAAPTPAPVTAPPTIAPLDCTTICSLPTQVTMAVNTIIRRVILPANFIFQFSVTLPLWNTGTQNILELKDALTGDSLIRVDRIAQSEAKWYWGGTAFSNGLNLANLALSVTSTSPGVFTATVAGTSINIVSNYLNYVNSGDTYAVAAINTTNRAYDLYVTNSVNSALGTVAAISFTSKLKYFLHCQYILLLICCTMYAICSMLYGVCCMSN